MAFQAGQKVRVSQLNELGGGVPTSGGGGTTPNPTGGYSMMTADLPVTNSTTLVEAPGLSFDLAANARYAIHGWLLYTASEASDLSVQPGVPSGATGRWSLLGAAWDQKPVTANAWTNYGKFVSEVLSAPLHVTGADTGHTLVAYLEGFVTTTAAGTQQVRVAQKVAGATATILRAGSWVRAVRVS